MKKFPLVSIVTPSYNQARFLEQTIQSVVAQDYPHLEYMIIDGNSTDDSLEIIRRFSDHLAYWVSEPDQGQADAINKGLRRAKGEIVAWLNSDDLYMPGAIQKVVEFFSQHPEAGLVYGDALSIDEHGARFNVMKQDRWKIEDLMAFRMLTQPAVFMRRSVLENVGYLDASFHFLLDHHLWLRLARSSEIIYMPVTLAAARFHPQAKNIAHAREFVLESDRIIRWMKNHADFEPLYVKNKGYILAGAESFNAYYWVESENFNKALLAYWRSFKLNPKTSLREWKRIIFSLLNLLGFRNLRRLYPILVKLRARKFK